MKEMNTCVLEPKGLNVRQILDDIQFNDLKLPEENRFRIPTMNQFGYMFTKFDPIVDKWQENAAIKIGL